MEPEELLDKVFARDRTKVDISKLETTNYDYYTCLSCKEDCTNICYDGHNFICVYCNTEGCGKQHGDVFLSEYTKLPKKVKEYIQNIQPKN